MIIYCTGILFFSKRWRLGSEPPYITHHDIALRDRQHSIVSLTPLQLLPWPAAAAAALRQAGSLTPQWKAWSVLVSS